MPKADLVPHIEHACTRIDTLTGPPVVGQCYLVPCVSGAHLQPKLDWWPLLGQPHTDKEIGFDKRHYHYDWRFLPLRAARFLTRHEYLDGIDDDLVLRFAQAQVLSADNIGGPDRGKPRSVVWQKRKCLRLVEFPSHLDRVGLPALFPNTVFANPFTMKCERLCAGRTLNLQTMQCPHKGLDLRQSPVVDGCITCPGHGLRFNATGGEIVSRFTPEEWATWEARGETLDETAEARLQRLLSALEKGADHA